MRREKNREEKKEDKEVKEDKKRKPARHTSYRRIFFLSETSATRFARVLIVLGPKRKWEKGHALSQSNFRCNHCNPLPMQPQIQVPVNPRMQVSPACRCNLRCERRASSKDEPATVAAADATNATNATNA